MNTRRKPARREPVPWFMPRRSKRPQRVALAIIVSLVCFAGFSAHSAYTRLMTYPDRPGVGGGQPITLTIPAGSSFPKVLEILQEHEVIGADEATAFKLFVLHRGAAGKVTAGKHTFRGDMTPTQILEELMHSEPVHERRVTIPEGKNSLQIAEIFANAGLGGDEEALLYAMRDPELLAELGIEGENAEGYLFPDTYRFSTSVSAEDIVRRLVKRHRQVYAELRKQHVDGARKLADDFEWGDPEIVIMASLIEKETGQAAERPRIASVFLNRLRFESFKPKLLQTDPTIIYGCTVPKRVSAACEEFEGRIRRIHLRDPDNPYNTYTHEGLPPGPISNPGRGSLEAVLAPERTRYLYFVSRNDGTHYFSKSRREHEEAVDKFIRGGAKGDGSVQK